MRPAAVVVTAVVVALAAPALVGCTPDDGRPAGATTPAASSSAASPEGSTATPTALDAAAVRAKGSPLTSGGVTLAVLPSDGTTVSVAADPDGGTQRPVTGSIAKTSREFVSRTTYSPGLSARSRPRTPSGRSATDLRAFAEPNV